MSKKITCPVCISKGDIPFNNSDLFEMRGKFQGKAIIKCKKCGSGLSLGWISGIFGGTAKIIQADLWERMEELWNKEFGTE